MNPNCNSELRETAAAEAKKKFSFREFFRQKSVRATAVLLVAALALVLIFFGVYGISRIDRAVKGKERIYGSVQSCEWSEEDLFDVTSYRSLTAVDGELTVLMLTDTHLVDGGWYASGVWTQNELNRRTYEQIDRLVADSSPDFIYVTGDVQNDLMNDKTQKDFTDFMGKFGVPWTMTFGDCDSEWRADKATLANILSEGKNCIFDAGATNLQGLGNTVVPVYGAGGELVYAFILMDFGDGQRLNDAEKEYSTVSFGVTDKQIAWYDWVVSGLERTAGKKVETMLLSHLPMHAFTYAVKLAELRPESGANFLYRGNPCKTYSAFGWTCAKWDEFFAGIDADENSKDIFTVELYRSYKENDKFYHHIVNLGSTKQIVSGHNHCGGYSVVLDGITFTSVVKTGDIFADAVTDANFRGGTVFKMKLAGAGANEITSEPVNSNVLPKANRG